MGKFRNPITLKDPEPGNEENGFGTSVAIHNGYVVVGNENGKSSDTGSVHVFKKSGMGFSYLQTLAAPDGEDGDYFGRSVAIHDGFIVVGAYSDNNPTNNEGSVYVYRLDRGEFRLHQKIPNPDGEANDFFGNSVAISDGYIVVGAYGDNVPTNDEGSVYVYRLDRGEFRLHQKIPNPDGEDSDRFGFSVAISDGFIVVGAYRDNNPTNNEGSVYVYRLERGEFRLLQHIKNPEPQANDRFGYNVAISDGYIVVGNDDNSANSGSVYVFRLERGEFRLLQHIKNPDKESPGNDYFGNSVAISDGYIVVGARGDTGSFDNEGSVYVYRLEKGEFRLLQHIKNPEPAEDDNFGYSVAIHDGRIVAGAYGNSSTGTAYVFSYGY